MLYNTWNKTSHKARVILKVMMMIIVMIIIIIEERENGKIIFYRKKKYLINVGEMIDLENNHFVTPSVTIDSGKRIIDRYQKHLIKDF